MTKLTDLRCVHRHSIVTHPACFAKGHVKWPDVKNVDKLYSKVTGQPWYSFPEYRIGYFDIEVDNLKADFGTVLTWCFKDKGGEVHSSVITKEEIINGTYDRRVVEEFVERMKTYKIIVGYFSTRFDLPYMRSKALHYGMEFPGYADIYHWDLFYTVRNKLCLSRKSLEATCDYLGIEGKTPISRNDWRKAKYGNKKSLETVLEHNIADVEILEELHDRIEFTRKWIKRSI